MSDITIDKLRSRFDWLLSPYSIIVSMTVGVLIGVYQKDIALAIAPFGNIYLALLQMCILPVLVCAVASSLGELVKSNGSNKSIGSMVLVFSVGLIVMSAVGILAGLIGQPGAGLDQETQAVLGQLVQKSGTGADLEMFFFQENPLPQGTPSFLNFFVDIIPSNVMESMAAGNNLQVLFFAIILGIATGFIPNHQSSHLLLVLEGVYLAFSKVIKWAMYILPFGLCCLMAEQVAKVGPEILMSMTKFIVVFVICALAIFVVCTVIIWRCSGKCFFETIAGLKEPIIIALGTRNSLATIPSALDALATKLQFDKTKTNLMVPLGVTICRYGSVIYFSLATMFVAQLYDTPLDAQAYAIILIGSIFAGMATSGASGVLTLAMMLLVLEPLGLPFEAVLVLFIAIDPIIDPLRTLLIVYVACATSALISGKEAYQNDCLRFEDDTDCKFTVGAIELSVISLDAKHIVCLSNTPIESIGALNSGVLKYAGVDVGHYKFRVKQANERSNGMLEVEMVVTEGVVDMDCFINHINELAEAV